ncbi:MAG: cytochrome c oxidase assembly protein subunit 15 [Candidatus Omnitrophota bacterium]|jgi:cytochrome c oxidase assembly protein subunit 15
MPKNKTFITAGLLFISTLILIIAGGLVTSTDSGLAVPDWPLSYGGLFPPMVGGIIYEHSHRVIAGCVLILIFILTWVSHIEKNTAVHRLATFGCALVLLQALFGGLTVVYLLPVPLSVAHACMGQIFFVLTAIIFRMSSSDWRDIKTIQLPGIGSFKHALHVLCFFLLIQLVLGALVRHTGGSHLMLHLSGALIILLYVMGLVWMMAASKPLRCYAYFFSLGFLIFVQLGLGVGAAFWAIWKKAEGATTLQEILFTTAHQTTGAVILALAALTLLHAGKHYQETHAK